MILSSITDMHNQARALRRDGLRIGLVPTMGALHEGHLSLIRLAKQHADVVVTSIFVNPVQFAPHEDFAAYPRDPVADAALARQAGCDIVFTPEAGEMYPPDFDTFVELPSLSGVLEGAIRPTHFRGVATVVLKLFHIISPHVAVFGQKDAQQALILSRMVQDLNLDMELIIAPIVREKDGLAMSSRNVYLTPEQRKDALVLSRALQRVAAAAETGEREIDVLRNLIHDSFRQTPTVELQYAACVDTRTLAPVTHRSPETSLLVALAAKVGSTRLIDNIILPPLEMPE